MMKNKLQKLSFFDNFVFVAILGGFFLSIVMIVTGLILDDLGIKTLLGINRYFFLMSGLALLSIYILGIFIIHSIEKLQVRSLQKKRLNELVMILREPNLEIDKLAQIVEVFTKKKDRQAIPYILEALEELINRIEKDKRESLSSLSLAIIPMIDSLVTLKANTKEAKALLTRVLKLAQAECGDNETAAGTLCDDIRNSVNQAIDKLALEVKPGKPPEVNIQLPWNISPLKGLKKIMAYAAATFLSFFSFFMVVGIIGFIVAFITRKNTISLIGSFFFFVLTIFSIKAIFYLNQRLELPRIGKFAGEWGGKSTVYHMFEIKLRGFIEFSKIHFRKDGMHISGSLAPSWLPFIIFIISINILFVIFGLMGNYTFFLFELMVLLIAALLYYYIGKKKSTIIVRPGNIRKVKLKGPIVKIKLIDAPISQLKNVKFLVPPSFQFSFFSKFDNLFPEVLPKQYRNALKHINQGVRESVNQESGDSMRYGAR